MREGHLTRYQQAQIAEGFSRRPICGSGRKLSRSGFRRLRPVTHRPTLGLELPLAGHDPGCSHLTSESATGLRGAFVAAGGAITVHGARASVAVGVFTTLLVALIGLATGSVAGFYGRWVDAVVSRIADVFYAIPLLLAAIVGLSALNNVWPDRGFVGAITAVVLALALFGWPQITRISRGAVLETKNLEFIDAARAIGATPRRNLMRHVIPNSLAPVIVTSTVSLGIFIVAEATLSFLGIGLPSSVVSWGNDIAAAQNQVRSGQRLGVMFWPAGALAMTVLSFILLGDAVRDALDPKAKKR